MATLDRIVNCAISLRTAGIQQANFSSMLILGPHTMDTARVMVVTDSNTLLDNGLSVNDPLYLAVSDAFGVIPAVQQILIGRQNVTAQSLAVGAVSAGQVISLQIGRVVSGAKLLSTVSYTVPASPTPTSVATALAAAITAVTPTLPLTAVATTGVIALTGSAAFSVENVNGNLTLSTPTSAEAPVTALLACQAENPSWYGIGITSRTSADVLAVAAWAETGLKLFGTAVSDVTALATTQTDVGALLSLAGYFRTFWTYHANAAVDYPEMALMSKQFTKYPGGDNWDMVTLEGIPADNLSETGYTNVTNKNGNTFEPFKDQDAVTPINLTQNGKVASGEWIDIVRFRDWLQDEIKVNVFSAKINARIPFTDPGIRTIKSKIQQSLDKGVKRGGIAPESVDANGNTIPSYTISVPLRSDVSDNDVANRVLNDVAFTAILAGSINKINIQGTLAYSFGN